VPKLFHLRASQRRTSASTAGVELFLARFAEAHPAHHRLSDLPATFFIG
jgi:hypothetical protein